MEMIHSYYKNQCKWNKKLRRQLYLTTNFESKRMARDTPGSHKQNKESRVCNVNIKLNSRRKNYIVEVQNSKCKHMFYSFLYTRQYSIKIDKVKIVGNKSIN